MPPTLLKHREITDLVLKAFYNVYNELGTDSWKMSTKTQWRLKQPT
jgi:hypothetical protein